MTLADFLLARIAEDEAVARAATLGPWDHDDDEVWHPSPLGVSLAVVEGSAIAADTAHIARHDPTRVLAECEAKRRIVEMHGTNGPHGAYCVVCEREPWPCRTVALLALPYADHPDYRDKWRP